MWAYDLDLGSHHDWRACASWYFVRVPSAKLVIGLIRLFIFDLWAIGPTRLRLITWPCDLVFDLGGHGACGWCGSLSSESSIRVPSLKFVSLAIPSTWRTMCVSINGPGDPDLWPFDLKTGMHVAAKVGNLPSKFGHASSSENRLFKTISIFALRFQID